MKNSKLTKLVALASVLLVSVATLAGSTVAWFTDTEEVVNTIQSGDLDVELQYKTVDENGTLTDWQEVEDNKQIFKENALYEPGYTEFVLLKVRNAGNLALQYKLSVDADNTVLGESVQQIKSAGTGDTIFLSDHLKLAAFPVELSNVASDAADFDTEVGAALGELSRSEIRAKIGDTVTDGTDGAEILYISDGFGTETRPAKEAYTTLTAEQADIAPAVIKSIVGATVSDIENIELWPKNEASAGSDYDLYGLVLYMPEEVGNEANNRRVDGDGKIINPEIELGIRLEAAQVVEESDSFDNQYDLNATYDGNVYSDTTSEEYKANVGGDGAAVNGYQPDSTPTPEPTAEPGGGDTGGTTTSALPFEIMLPRTIVKASTEVDDEGNVMIAGPEDTSATISGAIEIVTDEVATTTKGHSGFAGCDIQQMKLPASVKEIVVEFATMKKDMLLILPEGSQLRRITANAFTDINTYHPLYILYEGTDIETVRAMDSGFVNLMAREKYEIYYYDTAGNILKYTY